MCRFIATFLVAIGLGGLSRVESFAEERKSLEELLVEKGTITPEEAVFYLVVVPLPMVMLDVFADRT